MKTRISPMLLVVLTLSSCKKEPQTYTVSEKLLNEAVYASGQIFPQDYDYVRAGSAERIMKILVNEGDQVKKGDALVILGTPSQNTQISLLADEVQLARQNKDENSAVLSEAQQKIRLAKQQFEHDQVNAQRYKELALDKAVSQKDADNAALQAETSHAEYKNLEQQFLALKKELTGKLLTASRQLAQFRQITEGRILTSHVTGKIYSINMQEGAMAGPEEPILMAGSAVDFKIELLVDERDMNKVKLGQKVFFETDAFAGRQFTAKISKIIPVLQKENRSFKVEAQVTDAVRFFPQSSVEANILIRENRQSLVVPTDYLVGGDSVFVSSGDRGDKIRIRTGVRSGTWTEVIAGLKKGEVIIKP